MGSRDQTPRQIRLLGLGWWPSVSEGEDLEGRSSYLPLFMTVNRSAPRVMEAAALIGPWAPGLCVNGYFLSWVSCKGLITALNGTLFRLFHQ